MAPSLRLRRSRLETVLQMIPICNTVGCHSHEPRRIRLLNDTMRSRINTHRGIHALSATRHLARWILYIGGGITIALMFLGVYVLSWVVLLDLG